MATDPLDRTITYRDMIAVLDQMITAKPGSVLVRDQLMRTQLINRTTAAGQKRLVYRCLSCGVIISDQLPHSITNPGQAARQCPAGGWVTITITVTP